MRVSRPVPWGIGAHRLRKIRRPYATRNVAHECAKRTSKSAGGPGARSSAPGHAGSENFEVLQQMLLSLKNAIKWYPNVN